MKAIRVHACGGPEALSFEDVADPTPAAGQALVRVEAAGVNFIDIYQRTGLYPVTLPHTLGQEAAGVVTAVGVGVTQFAVGDRVACARVSGGYAAETLAPCPTWDPTPPEDAKLSAETSTARANAAKSWRDAGATVDANAEAKKAGVPDALISGDYKKMLDEKKPDLIWAFVENNRHLEIVEAAAARKIETAARDIHGSRIIERNVQRLGAATRLQ